MQQATQPIVLCYAIQCTTTGTDIWHLLRLRSFAGVVVLQAIDGGLGMETSGMCHTSAVLSGDTLVVVVAAVTLDWCCNCATRDCNCTTGRCGKAVETKAAEDTVKC